MRALVIAHDPASVAGLIGQRLEHHGFELEVLVLTESVQNPKSNVPFPNPSDYDLVVAMGAVWSVYDQDTIGSWIDRELDLLRQADRAGVPILGICFGGQALAVALGGDSVPAEEKQIGWFEIESAVPELASGPWMEWHYDQITPPPDAVTIAWDQTCVQAFRVRNHLGTQFHPEVDVVHLQRWLDSDGSLELAQQGIDADTLLRQTRSLEETATANANQLLDWFLTDVADLHPTEVPA